MDEWLHYRMDGRSLQELAALDRPSDGR
jgi:hypothetical protein